jgi:hypothetical protein
VLYQSKQVASRTPAPSLDGANDVCPIQAMFVVPAGGCAIGSVVEMHSVTPRMQVLDAAIHNTAGGAGATADFGLLSRGFGVTTGVARTCGAEFAGAIDMNGTSIKRMVKSQVAQVPPNTENLSDDTVGWGFKVTGAAWPAGMVVRATLYVATI